MDDCAKSSEGANASARNRDLLGLCFHQAAPERYLGDIINWSSAGEAGYCCVVNVHQCVLSHDDMAINNVVHGARLIVSDSVILSRTYALRHGIPYVAPMRGSDIMLALCERAAQLGVKIGLVGGKNDAALSALQSRLRDQFPDLEIVYAMSPPFHPLNHHEKEQIICDLGQSGAQLVFFGLGCPKQEIWMAEFSPQLDTMMIGVGAAFDFNASVITPSPRWVHRVGLEWLYRLAREPKRLWKRYLITSPRFVWLVMMDAWGSRSAR